MFGSWLVDAFTNLLQALLPWGDAALAPADGWGKALVEVWIPDLPPPPKEAGQALYPTPVFVLTSGLGLAVATWYAWAAVTSAIISASARALVQVGIGLVATTFAAPMALWVMNWLRDPITTTATNIAGEATGDMVTIMQGGLTPGGGALLGTLMLVAAAVTYLLAGVIGSYTLLLVTVFAPIAAASLVFRSGVATAGRWLAWFLSLLFAPIWVAIAFSAAISLSNPTTQGVLLAELYKVVGFIAAAAAPFTVLAMVTRLIPHGDGTADSSTRIGAGSTVGSTAVSTATRAIR